MSKKVHEELRYDGASVAQVREMLGTVGFREKVCAEIGVLRSDVTISPNGDGMEVVIDQAQSVDGLPSFATKFVGHEVHIVQSEKWADGTRGDIEVTIPGKPGHMVGTAVLDAREGGVTEVVDMTVSVHIPLVGGRIEDLIAGLLVKALRAENRTGKAWLAGNQ